MDDCFTPSNYSTCPIGDGFLCEKGAKGYLCASCEQDYVYSKALRSCTKCLPVMWYAIHGLTMMGVMAGVVSEGPTGRRTWTSHATYRPPPPPPVVPVSPSG